ncbi:hypothetical protein CLAFUW4_02351 [Fulvia fulva]|uniref:Uncharacterized protein n=1 Tax=Passalora fulva TaxID=5499 RepID=A0A9Q8LAN7_PASFU|nr:uncharacterized protein CLAFUR5_02340 [Fulvia fulva]KAK4631072.1 hypothetical protein CLAFUR4_02346 [Fulvia fulva]KAK4633488.1 hypothetical protein CLAFUR0_02350 [Fulvia fulva]UJO13871.1 hypothetical protein CLAFUR5_02340 [Fulvia fulva]WPV11031.1 hypothetical protein CLAFUW4_02351 [Fulvia fulva]WPV26433.1 hypothetical protein CLAFUW7_02351 [Fulvia fulva]
MARTRAQRKVAAKKVAAKKDSGEAARQVANTYELVEQIMIHLCDLEPVEIIRMEAVSKTFQHVLRRSKTIPPSLQIPRVKDLSRRFNVTTIYADGLPPIFLHFDITGRRVLVPDKPEISLLATIDQNELRDEKWRTGGMWRSWPVLQPNTTQISRVSVSGLGAFSPAGMSTGKYDVSLKHTSETAISLGQLGDMAYELQDLSGDFTNVQFDFAIDEAGDSTPWRSDLRSYDHIARGQKVILPEYGKAMAMARAMKELWKGNDAA